MSEEVVAVFVVSRLGCIEDVDDAGCALLGYSRDELLALHGSELVPPAERPTVAVSLDGMRRGALSAADGHLMRKDGSTVAVAVQSRLLGEGRMALRVTPAGGAAAH